MKIVFYFIVMASMFCAMDVFYFNNKFTGNRVIKSSLLAGVFLITATLLGEILS